MSSAASWLAGVPPRRERGQVRVREPGILRDSTLRAFHAEFAACRKRLKRARVVAEGLFIDDATLMSLAALAVTYRHGRLPNSTAASTSNIVS